MVAVIVMVTGSREWRDLLTIRDALFEYDTDPTNLPTLIHGCASGADAIARAWAELHRWNIVDFWPDYTQYDFATANKVRNLEMIAYGPDVVLAFPTASSRGTWHAVNAAIRADIEVKTYGEQ